MKEVLNKRESMKEDLEQGEVMKESLEQREMILKDLEKLEKEAIQAIRKIKKVKRGSNEYYEIMNEDFLNFVKRQKIYESYPHLKNVEW